MEVQLFSIKRNIVLRRPRSGNLQDFLLKDTGRLVFKGDFPLRIGYVLPLHLTASGEKVKPICLPRTLVNEQLNSINTAVQQEDRSGPVKVLYTWKNEADWGDPSKSFTEHILARKIDGNWRILPKAEIVKGQTAAGQRKAEARQTAELINRPEINEPTTFWQKTVQRKGETCLRVNVNGRRRYLFGFNGQREVMVVTVKLRGGEVRLSVYGEGQGLLRQFVFPADPKTKTRLGYSNASGGTQLSRLLARQIRDFLATDQAENAILDLEAKVVSPAGSLKLHTGGALHGGYIPFSGYGSQAGKKVYGRLTVSGREKKVFFWASAADRTAGGAPILPAGHVVARRTGLNGTSRWEIVWRTRNNQISEKIELTEKFGNFIFSQKSEGCHEESVPLHLFPNGRVRFERSPRGIAFGFELKKGTSSPVFVVTQKAGRSDLHLVELFENEAASRQKGPRLAACWLAIKPTKKGPEIKLFELVEIDALSAYLRLSYEKKTRLASHPAVYPYRPLLAKYF